MEIGEAVSISMPSMDECPFNHDLDDPPDVENDLVGVGQTLGSRMKSGKSTNLYDDYNTGKLDSIKNPRDIDSHPFSKKDCVKIEFDTGETKSYPVTCSAHHLIPAQEALKVSQLLIYMCKKNTSTEKNHSFSDGIVWSDVGYDVNGSENGIYLPGSYAVGGGKGGLKVWYPTEDPDYEDDLSLDEMPRDASYNNFLLYGPDKGIKSDNACWWYVAQAVKLCPGQFHDRHPYYSEQVILPALEALAEKLNLFNILIVDDSCGKCKKRKDDIEKRGLPAPYGLVNMLKHISNDAAKYLTASPRSWRENIYTSMWMKKYMDAVNAGGQMKKDAEMFE